MMESGPKVQRQKSLQCEAQIIQVPAKVLVNCEWPYYEKYDAQECGIVPWKPEITQQQLKLTYDTGGSISQTRDRQTRTALHPTDGTKLERFIKQPRLV